MFKYGQLSHAGSYVDIGNYTSVSFTKGCNTVAYNIQSLLTNIGDRYLICELKENCYLVTHSNRMIQALLDCYSSGIGTTKIPKIHL